MAKKTATKKAPAKKTPAARSIKAKKKTAAKPHKAAKKSAGASKYDQPGAPWWKKSI